MGRVKRTTRRPFFKKLQQADARTAAARADSGDTLQVDDAFMSCSSDEDVVYSVPEPKRRPHGRQLFTVRKTPRPTFSIVASPVAAPPVAAPPEPKPQSPQSMVVVIDDSPPKSTSNSSSEVTSAAPVTAPVQSTAKTKSAAPAKTKQPVPTSSVSQKQPTQPKPKKRKADGPKGAGTNTEIKPKKKPRSASQGTLEVDVSTLPRVSKSCTIAALKTELKARGENTRGISKYNKSDLLEVLGDNSSKL